MPMTPRDAARSHVKLLDAYAAFNLPGDIEPGDLVRDKEAFPAGEPGRAMLLWRMLDGSGEHDRALLARVVANGGPDRCDCLVAELTSWGGIALVPRALATLAPLSYADQRALSEALADECTGAGALAAAP